MYRIYDFLGFKINEDNLIDRALDKLKQTGNLNKLPELDKLILFANAEDTKGLRKISLVELFKQNGGKFDPLTIKVRIKEKEDQPVDHLFSKEEAGKEGWIRSPYIYSDHDDRTPYVTVRFPEFEHDSKAFGGGNYRERPIMLQNLYPIGYGEVEQEFIDHQRRVEQERKKFRKGFGGLE